MKRFFRSEVKSCIGVFLNQDAVYYSFLQRAEADKLHMLHTDSCRIFLEDKQEYPTHFEHIGQLAEELAVRCAENGIKEKKVVLSVPENMIFSYEKQFPPLADKEIPEAMHWEIEANSPFVKHVYTYRRGADNTYEIGIMEYQLMDELYKAFRDNGFRVIAVVEKSELLFEEREQCVVWGNETASLPVFFTWEKMGDEKEPLQQAFFAAWRIMRGLPKNENFLPSSRQEGAWDWRKTSACLILPVLFIFALVYGTGEWKLMQIEKEKKAVEQELFLRSGEQELQKDFLNKKKEIKASSDTLKTLGEKRISWYAVFTALGAKTVQGVAVDGIETTGKGAVRVKGTANGYELVSEYVGIWAEEPLLLKEAPRLETVETEKDGRVQFSLIMKF